MYKFVVASCLASAALGQFIEPPKAKILKEQRFNAGDGRFGAAYAQEDGTVYREETGANGERQGQYSYIDLAGKTITVRYTAGKDGFRILEGAHVPLGATGQNSAAYQQAQAGIPQQQQSFQPAAPVANSQHSFQNTAAPSSDYDYEYFDGPRPNNNNFVAPANNFVQNPAPVKQNFAPAPQQSFAPAPRPAVNANANPFINPHDPTHNNFRYNTNAGNYGGANLRSSAGVPPCADCAGVNPFINPYDNSHRNPGAYAPAPTQAPRNTFQQPQQFAAPATPAPKNFFPPGQLQLNRFENGFNFDFTSQ